MFRQSAFPGLPTLSRADRAAFRRADRALEKELADYASDADRNDLQVMVDASPTSAAWKVDDVLSGQAHRRLHRLN
jgi:hypothetical protein